eukprot:6173697-Lingulodinium_polyedra.AAC.1
MRRDLLTFSLSCVNAWRGRRSGGAASRVRRARVASVRADGAAPAAAAGCLHLQRCRLNDVAPF